jgi:hypothetical protein
MHFARGSAEEVINLLNAAEVIKETSPYFFLRMIGVAPGHDYGEREAERSNLFGNVFHLGLYRSLHLIEGSSGKEGLEVFRRRVNNLLDFSITVPDLLSISNEQMRAIERQFKAAADTIPKNEDSVGSAAVTLAAAYLQFIPGYKLRHDLDEMLRTVSMEEREHTLQHLRTASPDGFVQAVLDLPDAMADDPDIQDILYDRLLVWDTPGDLDEKEAKWFEYRTRAVRTLEAYRDGNDRGQIPPRSAEEVITRRAGTVRALKRFLGEIRTGKPYFINGQEVYNAFRMVLWRSADDAEVLSDEFQRDVAMVYADIESARFEMTRFQLEQANPAEIPPEERPTRLAVQPTF